MAPCKKNKASNGSAADAGQSQGLATTAGMKQTGGESEADTSLDIEGEDSVSGVIGTGFNGSF
jgi:hypothetical protein